MQLGPVIMSRFAKDRGLATSMLERFVTTEGAFRVPGAASGAAGGGSWGSHVAFLVRNYRSHPAIIDVPNTLFYGSRLQACGDPMVTNRCVNVHGSQGTN